MGFKLSKFPSNVDFQGKTNIACKYTLESESTNRQILADEIDVVLRISKSLRSI